VASPDAHSVEGVNSAEAIERDTFFRHCINTRWPAPDATQLWRRCWLSERWAEQYACV